MKQVAKLLNAIWRGFFILTAIGLVVYFALMADMVGGGQLYKNIIKYPTQTLMAVKEAQRLAKQDYPEGIWYPVSENDPFTQRGVVTHDATKASEGYTAFIAAHEQKAFLINMAGEIKHEWHMPFHKVWPDAEHLQWPVPENLIFWGRFYLYPNGDLLAHYATVGTVLWGAGLVKVDKDSNLIWSYNEHANHDIEVDDQGNIYTYIYNVRMTPHDAIKHIDPPFLEDFIVVLSPDGKELKRISLIDAFAGSQQSHFISPPHLRHDPTDGIFGEGDMLHPNSIEIITQDIAGKAPMLNEGHLLLSFRNTDLLAVLDPETEKITWASYGPWKGQHDPRFMKDGSIVLFDNEGHLGSGGPSRALQIDLNTLGVLWQYTGTPEQPLYSALSSSIDILPDENVLLTSSFQGRLIEVNRDGNIVWEYRLPWEAEQNGKKMRPFVFRGRRFGPEDLTFLEPENPEIEP